MRVPEANLVTRRFMQLDDLPLQRADVGELNTNQSLELGLSQAVGDDLARATIEGIPKSQNDRTAAGRHKAPGRM